VRIKATILVYVTAGLNELGLQLKCPLIDYLKKPRNSSKAIELNF